MKRIFSTQLVLAMLASVVIVIPAAPAGADEPTYVAPNKPPATVISELPAPDSAVPADLIVNGSFETGDFTGWGTKDIADPFSPLIVVGPGFDPWGSFFSTAPTDGTFVASHGFDGGGPDTIELWQDIAIPATTSFASLEFDWRAAWDLFAGPTADRSFDVVIEPAGGGAALSSTNLLTTDFATTLTNPDTGPMSASFDLIAFAGTTVRVKFVATIPEFFTGPGHVQIDKVSLLVDPARIGNRVFNDRNQNGVRNGSVEHGIPGLTVELLNAAGAVVDSRLTNPNGGWSFFVDPSEDWQVRVIPPPAAPFTAQDVGSNEVIDSDADPATGIIAIPSSELSAGEFNSDFDAGIIATARIGDWVWDDLNGDGVNDWPLEPGIPGVRVELLDDTDALVDARLTNANGGWSFFVDPTMDWQVRVVAPNRRVLTLQDVGSDDTLDSDADRTTGIIDVPGSMLLPAGFFTQFDAGLIDSARIGDRVWEDSDSDGIQDPGEPTVPGVEVFLVDSSFNLVTSRFTNANGGWSFFVDPHEDWNVFIGAGPFTLQDVGPDDTVDSDADPGGGIFIPASELTPGVFSSHYDAGLLPPPPPCSPDAFEPDDGTGTASSIMPGVPQTHSICPGGDEDWSTFTLTTESSVILETTGTAGDTVMWLRDAGASEIEFDDDGGVPLFSMIDRLCGVDALPAGTYFVQVEAFGDPFEEIFSYDLSLTVAPCP